jgi:hypothetical protein
MEINYHLLNLLITIVLFVYLIYLLFFVNESTEVKNLITDIVNNRFGRLIIILAIVFISVGNKLKIGGPKIGILVLVVYLLTFSQMNTNTNETFDSSCMIVPNPQNPYNPHPYRPGDSALASGIPDPIPQVQGEMATSGPCALSGVSRQFGMN